jgi:hypothetical protein
MTARQVAQRFGIDNISDRVKKKLDGNSEDKISIIHAVFPRSDREILNDGSFRFGSDNMPYASVWFEEDGLHLMKESGFRTFPFMVARWDKEAGQVYGHGPIMDNIEDIKVLNAMRKTFLKLAQKIADPPNLIQGADTGELDQSPGASNNVDAEVKVTPLVTGANFPVTEATIREQREIVKEDLFMNQLQMPNRDRMTAEEIVTRRNENLRILGPVGSFITSEGIRNFVVRALDLMNAKSDLIPQLPESLKKENYRIRYVNQFDRAQKQDESNAIINGMRIVGAMEQTYPAAKYVINGEKATDIILRNEGFPTIAINDDRTRKQMKENDAKEAEFQRKVQMAQIQGALKEQDAKTEDRKASADKKRRAA